MAVHLIVSGEPVNSFRNTRGRRRSQCLASALVNASQPQGIPAGVESGLTLTSFANLTHRSIMGAELFYSKFCPAFFLLIDHHSDIFGDSHCQRAFDGDAASADTWSRAVASSRVQFLAACGVEQIANPRQLTLVLIPRGLPRGCSFSYFF